MLIMLEGLDGTGKSTLARQLSEILEMPVVNILDGDDHKQLRAWGIPVNSYVDDIYFTDFWKRTGIDCIVDRCFISACVYGDVPTEVKEYWFRQLRDSQQEVSIIWLDADNETIAKRDREWEGKGELLNEQREKFRRLMLEAWNDRTHILHINTSNMGSDRVLGRVLDWIL